MSDIQEAIDDVVVDYEKLITAHVKVQDKDGNLFYLDPARKQGEFILRVVPKPVSDEAVELPPEWVRPAKEDKPEGVINWGMNQPIEQAEGESEVETQLEGKSANSPEDEAVG
jgi:hypothetical protein